MGYRIRKAKSPSSCATCVTTGTSFHFLEWMVSPPGKQSSISMALTEGNVGDLFQPPLPGYSPSQRGSHTGKSLKNPTSAHHIHSRGRDINACLLTRSLVCAQLSPSTPPRFRISCLGNVPLTVNWVFPNQLT